MAVGWHHRGSACPVQRETGVPGSERSLGGGGHLSATPLAQPRAGLHLAGAPITVSSSLCRNSPTLELIFNCPRTQGCGESWSDRHFPRNVDQFPPIPTRPLPDFFIGEWFSRAGGPVSGSRFRPRKCRPVRLPPGTSLGSSNSCSLGLPLRESSAFQCFRLLNFLDKVFILSPSLKKNLLAFHLLY